MNAVFIVPYLPESVIIFSSFSIWKQRITLNLYIRKHLTVDNVSSMELCM
jgi:hypothetical protein